MNLRVRSASASDETAISAVVLAAFGGTQGLEVSALVSALQVDATAKPVISLVAESDGLVIAHILLTKARLAGPCASAVAAILAPLAVHPGFQGRGVGGRLIREGREALRAAGCELLFVLGHPGYYPKHGFVVAGRNGFEAPYPIHRSTPMHGWFKHSSQAGSGR
jgi:putative acetyltransferase